MNESAASCAMLQVDLVQSQGLGRHQPDGNVYTGAGQLIETAVVDSWVGIFGRYDDATNTGLDQCIGTGWGSAVMTARLEVAIESSAASQVPGHLDGIGLSMSNKSKLVEAFADDAAILDDDRPHQRIGAYEALPQSGQFQRPRHEFSVQITHESCRLQVASCRLRVGSCTGRLHIGRPRQRLRPSLFSLPPIAFQSSIGNRFTICARASRPSGPRAWPHVPNCSQPSSQPATCNLLLELPGYNLYVAVLGGS